MPTSEYLINQKRKNIWLLTPPLVWIFLFLIVPLGGIVVFSFWKYSSPGMIPDFTFENYLNLFSSKVYLTTFLNTVKYTGIVMLIAFIIGYPLAYFLSMIVEEQRNKIGLFLICMIPFWTSYIIRTIAWIPILGKKGLINYVLLELGIVDEPVSLFLYSEFALILVMVQIYTIFMVAPIFFSMVKIDKDIVEAARSMGATEWQIFRRIIFPMTHPGVAIGSVFVFVMVMGEFATPRVIGGGKVSTTGTIVMNLAGIINWPFAAANGVVLLLAMMIGVWIIFRLVNVQKEL